MKYLVRTLKYYVRLIVLLVVMIAILMLAGVIENDLAEVFRNGYDSLWQIALMALVFAAIYPRVGYGKRRVRAAGSAEEILPTIEKYMNSRGYIISKRDGETIVFRKASTLERIRTMFEDKVTFTREIDGYTMEGMMKEVIRLDTGLTQTLDPRD